MVLASKIKPHRLFFRPFVLLLLIIGLSFITYLVFTKKISNVFALNGTYQTWTFSTTTSGDYTKSQINSETVMTVDNDGAHPLGGSVGANEFANPGFASGSEGGAATNWSVAAVPPTGWVEVPGNGTFGTSNFLVMKYEAKCDTDGDGIGNVPAVGDVCSGAANTNGTGWQYGAYRNNGDGCACTSPKAVVSTPQGYGIAYINHTTSKTYCNGVSLNGNATHLLTNDEWMTIARNAEAQSANWCAAVGGYGVYPCGNTPGTGKLASGHCDYSNEEQYTSTKAALEASANDDYACYRTTTGATTCAATSGMQKRTFTLSNGAIIWDLAGNMWEHVQRSTNNSGDSTAVMDPLPACSDGVAAWGYCEFGSTTTPYISSWTAAVIRDLVGPSDSSYNSAQGVGTVYTYKNGTTQSSTTWMRGGEWGTPVSGGAYALGLRWYVGSTALNLGFRCSSDAVNISQLYSGSSGRSGGGDTVSVGSITDSKIYQSLNLGDTATYDFTAYVYNNTSGHEGEAVDGTIASLYYGGNTISDVAYTEVTNDWYKLTGTITGVAAAADTGLLVKAGKAVKVDDFTLSKQGTYSVTTTSAYSNTTVTSWDSFAANETASGNAYISYQLCTNDGSTCDSDSSWKYWDGSAWQTTANTTTHVNTEAQLTQAAMQSLPVASQKIAVKAIMSFGAADIPYLTSLQIGLTADNTAPTISLSALADPNTDTTPSLSGTVTEDKGTVASVSFQMDSTSGSWTNCIADDDSFDETTETFTCTVASALSDGSHTMYVRAKDSNDVTTASGSESTDSFTIDTTAPVSLNLESPGNNTYTNNERPSFKWKATSDATTGLAKYVLEIDNSSLGTNQPIGDFTINDIPVERTTDYETNKYIIQYENFADADGTNNFISVYTKSHSDWNLTENDGKLREGKITWKVKAVDQADNETSSSRTLFLDRTGPKLELAQVNEAAVSATAFTTNDHTPTFVGKLTDGLAGGDTSLTQDENGPKIAAGPKELNVKIEKKMGLVYQLHTTYTFNFDKTWWICNSQEVTDNTKQNCDKYASFTYAPTTDLDYGNYRVTLSGKDKADTAGTVVVLDLNISDLAQITTSVEKKIIKEELKKLTPDQQKKVEQELQLTKAIEPTKPSLVETVVTNLVSGGQALWQKTAGSISQAIGGTKQGIITVSQIIADQYNNQFTHTTGVTRLVLTGIGQGLSNITSASIAITQKTTTTLKGEASVVVFGIGEQVRNVSNNTGLAIIEFAYNFVSEPVAISQVEATVLSPTSVKITWRTNHPANGKVNYGFEDGVYTFEQQTEKRTNDHEFVITGLNPDTEYHYEVMSHGKNYVYDANRKFKTPVLGE